MEETITLTISASGSVGLGLLAGLILLSLSVRLILTRSTHVEPSLEAIRKRLGPEGSNDGAFPIFAIVWTLPLSVLFSGAKRTADGSLFTNKTTADLHARRRRTMRGITGLTAFCRHRRAGQRSIGMVPDNPQ